MPHPTNLLVVKNWVSGVAINMVQLFDFFPRQVNTVPGKMPEFDSLDDDLDGATLDPVDRKFAVDPVYLKVGEHIQKHKKFVVVDNYLKLPQ